MSDTNWFEVTVFRVNESAHKSPTEVHKAHTVRLDPDGTLNVKWESGGHSYGATTFDEVHIKRFRNPTSK